MDLAALRRAFRARPGTAHSREFADFLEGLETNGELHPLQAGFKEEHGLQCGFCTPGMIMRSHELLSKNPNPSEEEIRWGISGNLCRCTGYVNIVKSVQYAAKQLKGGK